jgi:hypothetical protein
MQMRRARGAGHSDDGDVEWFKPCDGINGFQILTNLMAMTL